MADNLSGKKLCHIMEHIADFDFRTPEALAFKQELRWWYYNGRDSAHARSLTDRFSTLFSGNAALDVAGDLLRDLGEQSPLELEEAQRQALQRASGGSVTGRSIRAYGITDGDIQYQFPEWKKAASERLSAAMDAVGEQLNREQRWRGENRMTLFSALISLAGIASLVLGLLVLLAYVLAAISNWSFVDAAAEFRLYYFFGEEDTLICIGLLAAAVLFLAVSLPRMAMTVAAGMFWTFYQKRRFRLRTRVLGKFRAAMIAEGVNGYFEKLSAAAGQLRGQSWALPRNQDPSRELLGQSGMGRLFQTYPLRPLSGCLDAKKFFQQVEKRHVRSRFWIVFLSLGASVLGILLWNPTVILR